MTETPLTPSRLWKKMSPAQRQAVARAFWSDEESTADQLQAVALIAQAKKFRPKTVLGFEIDQKTRHLAGLISLPEPVAARALITYHLTERRPMMSAFLDALGIAHEEGVIADDSLTAPDTARLAAAAADLAASHAAEDVSLYLNTLLSQDPDTWGGLAGLPQLIVGEL